MSLKTLEIAPNRLLMDSNFDGYKLSLKPIKQSRKSLQVPVEKTCVNPSQYSIVHVKLLSLHNHLCVDQFDGFSSVYFVDKQLTIQKVYVDAGTNELVDPVAVYTMSKPRERLSGDYGVTLRFASADYCVASDGIGTFYILATKDKRDDDQFDTLFSGHVLSNESQGFVVSDASFNDAKQELHVLLLHVQEHGTDGFISIIHWITFKKTQKDWHQVALRQLKTKGEVQYLQLESDCDHLYVVSENLVVFALNSEHPIEETPLASSGKLYHWSQDTDEITVKIPLPETAQKNLLKVSCGGSELNVEYNSLRVLSGTFQGSVDSALTTWSLKGDLLEIQLAKADKEYWTQLLAGYDEGEQDLSPSYVDEVHNRLQGFTSKQEETPQRGTTFNSQPIEECDFETDKAETFQRISGVTNKPTHQVHLGSHHVLLSPFLDSQSVPALGIRHDVDVCLWQPTWNGQDFTCQHQGTLLAFGYVQASKTNRKFLTCSQNLDYAVVSESAGHIFIYRQNRPLLTTELRQRSTGRRVKRVAEQQVINLSNESILGIFAGDSHLFVLGEDFVTAFSMNVNNDAL
ncbi:hypothetical protein HUJ04_008700 [Dendroctonus ponderosae]